MQLNVDAWHVPLSSDSHISTMIDGMPSRSTLGHLSQLEVHKLLHFRDQVVSPEGLNGGFRAQMDLPSRTACLGHVHPWQTCP